MPCRPSEPRMAVGRGHHSLRHHWHRPEADTGDVHCMRREKDLGEGVRREKGGSISRGYLYLRW